MSCVHIARYYLELQIIHIQLSQTRLYDLVTHYQISFYYNGSYVHKWIKSEQAHMTKNLISEETKFQEKLLNLNFPVIYLQSLRNYVWRFKGNLHNHNIVFSYFFSLSFLFYIDIVFISIENCLFIRMRT